MAFEPSAVRVTIRDNLVAILAEVPIEGSISHEQIEEIIGPETTSPDAIKYSAFKLAAEDHGAAFENIRGAGYRRLAAADINRLGVHVRHRIRGHARRGSVKIQAVMSNNSNSMTNQERLRAHAEIGLLGIIQMSAGRGAAMRAYKAAEAADKARQAPPSQGEIASAVMAAMGESK